MATEPICPAGGLAGAAAAGRKECAATTGAVADAGQLFASLVTVARHAADTVQRDGAAKQKQVDQEDAAGADAQSSPR